MPTVARTITLAGVGVSGGGGGGGTNAGLFGLKVVTPSGGNATIDIAALGAGTTCFKFKLTLNGSAVTILAPIWTGGTIVAGIEIWIYVVQDATGNRAKPVFTGGAGGFATDIIAWEPDPTHDTMTAYQLNYMGTRWTMDAVRNKCALS